VKKVEAGGLDQGAGVGQAGPQTGAEVRKCNLDAQSPDNAKEEFKREAEKELTGKDCEPSELIYFKVYRSQVPVIDRAIETAALMLGSDKSRGYCLEMICADFLAGASLDGADPDMRLRSISRYYRFLPDPQRKLFLHEVTQGPYEDAQLEMSPNSAQFTGIQRTASTRPQAR
jgi:hypothetical protein